ncbi:hypothetical protein Rsub_04395 [Raphidocelis subcapitata]|uniref:Uncharacterized protein n=1 Tax=Raphidocelis subcapitata TaxID=307507 RepID=A0A2V0NWM8_9CHLO|nr:hypothetical protein Rsub_04395 [Raphidocelis subcapitata]|eukprot:GBF92048.1 hypothetical protein Rsub_04395 [Raphidocelis subcapitata]
MALQQGMALRAPSTAAGSRRARAALAPPRSRSSSGVVVRASLGGLGGSSADAVGIARALGVGLAAVAAGLWLKDEMQQQERLESPARRACPACEGRGVEPCACTRWSDGDAGCRSCRNSGLTQCRSCGGGGTAVPIKVTIRSDGR